MRRKITSAPEKRRVVSVRRHQAAHAQAVTVPHAGRMRSLMPDTGRPASSTRIARLAIRVGDPASLRAHGFSALRKVGSVTLFRWPADVVAAGYSAADRPRHFVRLESGAFPARLLRAYQRLKTQQLARTSVSLVEIRAFHVHLAWARTSRRRGDDRVIVLLPNVLALKPGRQYSRVEVEQTLSDVTDR